MSLELFQINSLSLPVLIYVKEIKRVSSAAQSLRHVQLPATPWTAACKAPVSRGSPRQEYWNGLPFPSPGDFPDPGIEPASPALVGGFLTTGPPGKSWLWLL